MKNLPFIVLMLFCFCFSAKAQQIVPSGGFSDKQGISVEWVLGGTLFGTNTFVVNDPPGVKSALIQETNPELAIKVYPTYTKDFVTVEITPGANPLYFIDLYNNTGEKVIERIIMKQPSVQVKMTDLASGIYFLKVTSAAPEQLIHKAKIIKL